MNNITDRAYAMENYGEYTVRGKVYKYRKFKFIENWYEAYTVGYFACDGAFVANCGFPFMSISSIEPSIIDGFRKYWCPNNIVRNVGKKSSKKVKAVNDVYELRLPARLSVNYKKYGVFDYKINRRVVGIKRSFFLAYLAGCIDSDGFVTVTHRKDCRTPRLRFFITHCSEKFLSDIQNRLADYNVNTTLRQHGKNVYRLQSQNTKQNIVLMRKVCQYMQNFKKYTIVKNYLKLFDVPQESDELLEGES